MDLTPLTTHGPWALLSAFLLMKAFKRNETLEKKYQTLLEKSLESNMKMQEMNCLMLEVIKQNQSIVTALSDKYDGLKKSVDILNLDMREIYRAVCAKEESP